MPDTATEDYLLTGFNKFLIASQQINAVAAQQYLKAANKMQLTLLHYLIVNNVVDGLDVASKASVEYGLPCLDLAALDLNHLPLHLLNEKLIRKHLTLPLYVRGNTLFIALSDPTAESVLDEIKFHSQLHPEIILVEQNKLTRAIDSCIETTDKETIQLLDKDNDTADDTVAADDIADDIDIDDTPIVSFVNKTLADAIKKGASDIHLEPYEKYFRIRFRTDGMLYQYARPPLSISNRIISRIKVMAKMNISEHRVPQDGRIKVSLNNIYPIDFRVSCCPTLFGEKMVLRILDPNKTEISIKDLGFEPEQEQVFMEAINKPYGMILVTGPTGSGKTITLYTALKLLNHIERNICTVEDPVEITVEGINQVHVNLKTGLTFATALRSFLRQDPDVIMVGEIRDFETADIAVKAAQTGHLVLSTLHTNDAPQTLNRLLQMGIEPYNVASAILLIMAQRLVRCLCPLCKKLIQLPEATLLTFGFTKAEMQDLKLFGPVGCDNCKSGYKGRVGIFQLMPLSDNMRNLILDNGNAEQISALADLEGIHTLRTSGLNKVRLGITSLEEIDRITKEKS